MEAFKKYIVALTALKSEAEKRGPRSSIEIKIFRLAKTAGGSKAFTINSQELWDLESTRFTFSQRVTPSISQLRTWLLPSSDDRLSRLMPLTLGIVWSSANQLIEWSALARARGNKFRHCVYKSQKQLKILL